MLDLRLTGNRGQNGVRRERESQRERERQRSNPSWWIFIKPELRQNWGLTIYGFNEVILMICFGFGQETRKGFSQE